MSARDNSAEFSDSSRAEIRNNDFVVFLRGRLNCIITREYY